MQQDKRFMGVFSGYYGWKVDMHMYKPIFRAVYPAVRRINKVAGN